MFVNSLLQPFLETEHMGVEAIFAIAVTAFSPRNDTNLIPPAIIWVLKWGEEQNLSRREQINR